MQSEHSKGRPCPGSGDWWTWPSKRSAEYGQAQTRRDQCKAAVDRGGRALRLALWLLVSKAREHSLPFLNVELENAVLRRLLH